MSNTATIRITDLKVSTIIGTNAWERKMRQTVIINGLFLYDAQRAIQTDQLKDAMDYKTITKKIIQCVRASQDYLLEKLTHRVLKIIMEDARIREAAVRIDKPRALRFSKSVSVELKGKKN